VSVAPEYLHVTKLVRPAPTVSVDGAELKWYEIAPAEQGVPRYVRDLAREALASGEFDLRGDDMGFLILHRCGESFYFLIVSTWRNDNELWESVWAKDGEEASAFESWPIPRDHRPTFCVWELGAVCHEQRSWSRYLRSGRDAKAKEAYLGDAYAGLV
jgi:hypothetical protein